MPTIAQLTADIRANDNASGTIEKVGQAVDALGKKTGGLGSVSDSTYNKMGAGLLGVGGAITGVLAAASVPAIDFDTAKTQMMAFADFEEEQADRVGESIIKLAAASKFGTSDVGRAAVELAKAGFKESEIVNGALEGTIDLAAAADIAVDEAATNIARNAKTWNGSIQNIDDWDADQSGSIDMLENITAMNDISAKAAADSTLDFKNISDSYVDMTGAMLNAGQDYESGMALLVAGAQRGIIGSEAGNSVKALLGDLITHQEDWAAAGVDIIDPLTGGYRDILDIITDLDKATQGMTDPQRAEVLSTLTDVMGQKILGAALDYDNKTGETLQDAETNLLDVGAAADMANKQTEGFAGTYEQLSGSIEAARTAVGEDYQQNLMPSIERMTGLVNGFTEAYMGLTDEQQKAIVGGIGMTGTLTGMAGTALLAIPKIREVQRGIEGVASGSGLLAGAARMIPGLLTGMGVAAGVGILGLAAYRSNFLGFADLMDGRVIPAIEAGINGWKGWNSQFGQMAKMIKNGRVARGGTELAGWLEGAGYAAKVLTDGVIDLTGPLNATADAIDAVGAGWQTATQMGFNPAESALYALAQGARSLGLDEVYKGLMRGSKAAGAFGDGVEAAVKTGMTPLAAIAGGVANALDTLGFEEAAQKAYRAQAAIEGFGQGFENAIISGLNPLSAVLGGLAGGADALGMAELADNLRSFGADIQGVVDSILPGIQQLATGIGDALGGGIRRVGDFLGELGGLDISGMGDVLGQAATDAQNWIGEQAGNISATVTQAVDLVVNLIAGAIQFGGNIISEIGTRARQWLEDVVSGGAAGSQPGGPRDVSPVGLGGMSTIDLAIEALKVMVKMVGEPIIEGAEAIITSIMQAAQTKLGEFFGTGGQLAGDGTSLTGSGIGQAGEALRNVQISIGNITANLMGVGEVALNGVEQVKSAVWNQIQIQMRNLFGGPGARSSDGQIYSDATPGALAEAGQNIQVTLGNITATVGGIGEVTLQGIESVRTAIWNAIQAKIRELFGGPGAQSSDGQIYSDATQGSLAEAGQNIQVALGDIQATLTGLGQVTITNAQEMLGQIKSAVMAKISELMSMISGGVGGEGGTGQMSAMDYMRPNWSGQGAGGGISLPFDLSALKIEISGVGMPTIEVSDPMALVQSMLNAVKGAVATATTNVVNAMGAEELSTDMSGALEVGHQIGGIITKVVAGAVALTFTPAILGGYVAAGIAEGINNSPEAYNAGSNAGDVVGAILTVIAGIIGQIAQEISSALDAGSADTSQMDAAMYSLGASAGQAASANGLDEFKRGFGDSIRANLMQTPEGQALLDIWDIGQFINQPLTGDFAADGINPDPFYGMLASTEIGRDALRGILGTMGLSIAEQEEYIGQLQEYYKNNQEIEALQAEEPPVPLTPEELAAAGIDPNNPPPMSQETLDALEDMQDENAPGTWQAPDYTPMTNEGDIATYGTAEQQALEATKELFANDTIGIGPAANAAAERIRSDMASAEGGQGIVAEAQAMASGITEAGQQGSQIVSEAYQAAIQMLQQAATGGGSLMASTGAETGGGEIATDAPTIAPMPTAGIAGGMNQMTEAAGAATSGAGAQLLAQAQSDAAAITAAGQQGAQMVGAAYQQAIAAIQAAASGGAAAGGTTPTMGPGGAQAPVTAPTAAPTMGPGGAGSAPAATGGAAPTGGSGLAASVTAEFQAVVQAAQQGGSQAAQAVTTAAGQIGTAMSTAATEVSSAAQEIITAIQQIPAAVSAAASEAAAAAASIGPGIAAGIRSGIADVEAAAGEMAAAATTPVVQKVNPGSPSKWGIGIGQTIPQGIALGIEQKSPLVQQAAEKLGYEAEQGLQPLMDSMSATGQAAGAALGVNMEEALASKVMGMEGWDPKSQVDMEAMTAFQDAAVRMEKYGKRKGDEAASAAAEGFKGLADNMSAILMGTETYLSDEAAKAALKGYRKLDADAKSKLPDDIKDQLKATYDEANITIGDVINQRMEKAGMDRLKGAMGGLGAQFKERKEMILRGMLGQRTLEQKAQAAAEDGLSLAIDQIKSGLQQGGQDAQSAIKQAVGGMGQGAAGGMGGPGEAAKQAMMSGGMGTGDGSMEDLAWGICECVSGANKEMLGSMGFGGIEGGIMSSLGTLGHDLSGSIGGTGQEFSKAMYDYAKANPVEGHNPAWMEGAPSVEDTAGCMSICKETTDQMGSAMGDAAGSAMGANMPSMPKPGGMDMGALGKSAGAEMASQTASQCTSLCGDSTDEMAKGVGGAVEDGIASQAMDSVEIGNTKQMATDIRKGIGAPMGGLESALGDASSALDPSGIASEMMGEETTDECCSSMSGAADDMASGTSDLGGQIEELANSQVQSKMAETMKGIEEGLGGGGAADMGNVPDLIMQLNPNIERAMNFDIADTNPHAAALMGGGGGIPGAGPAGHLGGLGAAMMGASEQGLPLDQTTAYKNLPAHMKANPLVAFASRLEMAKRGIEMAPPGHSSSELTGSSSLQEIQRYKAYMAKQDEEAVKQTGILTDIRRLNQSPPEQRDQELNINLKTELDGKVVADSTVKYLAPGLESALNNTRSEGSSMVRSRKR